MATPFPFTSGQTLTAAQMNAITTLPSTTKTASHTLVIADQGTRVIMNSGTATTITVNNSIFGASDIVEIQNIGTAVCTMTAGSCTVSSAGPLAIPQHGGGQLVFSSGSAATFFPTAVTAASSGALTFIKSQAIVAGATTFTMTSAFSATYENYLITAQNLVMSGAGNQIRITIGGSTSTTYSTGYLNLDYSSSTVTGTVASAVSTGVSLGDQTANSTQFWLKVFSPFLAAATTFEGQQTNTTGGRWINGIDTNAASSTAFTLTMATNTFTSGDIRIYGIATS